jgi:hypothetical protein
MCCLESWSVVGLQGGGAEVGAVHRLGAISHATGGVLSQLQGTFHTGTLLWRGRGLCLVRCPGSYLGVWGLPTAGQPVRGPIHLKIIMILSGGGQAGTVCE